MSHEGVVTSTVGQRKSFGEFKRESRHLRRDDVEKREKRAVYYFERKIIDDLKRNVYQM